MTIQKKSETTQSVSFHSFLLPYRVKKLYTTDLANTRPHNYRESQKKKNIFCVFSFKPLVCLKLFTYFCDYKTFFVITHRPNNLKPLI